MAGKLIVVEGLDGSGKTTQLSLLRTALEEKGLPVRQIKLPNYGSAACAPVQMYLNGEFGATPGDVNAYAASALYAVDRFASFRLDWQADYEKGAYILCDRYATSNLYHQATKLPQTQWAEFFDWCADLEYTKIGIPKPDLVLYLDMPPLLSRRLLLTRYEGDAKRQDIHERDLDYLERCREGALFAAERLGWIVLSCVRADGEACSVEEMQRRLSTAVQKSGI